MKIASKIKPRSGLPRRVTFHGKLYVFAPTTDKYDDIHYVADVKNEEHVEQLLGTQDFYAYGADLAPKPQLIAPATSAPQPTPLAADNATQVEAEALLSQSAPKISTALGAASSIDVVKSALAIENGKPEPRKTVIALLSSAIGFADSVKA